MVQATPNIQNNRAVTHLVPGLINRNYVTYSEELVIQDD